MKHPITLKSPEEIEILRQAGKRLASIIKELSRSLKSGITTAEVDGIAEKLIASHDAQPAFKGYRGFPGCICISINQEVVHGIPGKRVLNEGDLVKLDVGIIYKNYYSDTALTAGVGQINPQLENLLNVTKDALYKGIAQAQANNHLSDISHAVQSYAEKNNFSVVRDFVGHGIGRSLHEEPELPNFGPPHCGPVLTEGMVLAIEPMVNIGTWQTKILNDGWTVVTLDGKPSAHFEHTVAITKSGPEILTE